MLPKILSFCRSSTKQKTAIKTTDLVFEPGETIGIIAGSGVFPIRFAKSAKEKHLKVAAICHFGETDKAIESIAEYCSWIKVGQLGAIVSFFKEHGVKRAVMAGGISRVRTFKDVDLDFRGAILLAKIRSTKDDVIMRGVAEELSKDGIEVVNSIIFASDWLVEKGVLTKAQPTFEQYQDIEIGREALKAMTGLHIGQLVVVKSGVIVAVEAVEGSDEAIKRGGFLGQEGTVVVKCAKPDQDMRFDVPTAGVKTIETMIEVEAKVLALEAGRSIIVDKERTIDLANQKGIAIVGCEPIIERSTTSDVFNKN